MDDDLQKLYVALQHAEREWREHIETGIASWYGSDPQTAIGTPAPMRSTVSGGNGKWS